MSALKRYLDSGTSYHNLSTTKGGAIIATTQKSLRRLTAPIRLRLWAAAFGRRRGGVAVGRRIGIRSASLQPGTGDDVGGKGRWTAFAVPPQTEPAGGRGKIATVVSGGACKATASGMPPGPARVRASLYVHDHTP